MMHEAIEPGHWSARSVSNARHALLSGLKGGFRSALRDCAPLVLSEVRVPARIRHDCVYETLQPCQGSQSLGSLCAIYHPITGFKMIASSHDGILGAQCSSDALPKRVGLYGSVPPPTFVTGQYATASMFANDRSGPLTAQRDTPPAHECELCRAHEKSTAAGFVHLHYPRDHDCVSAAYGDDGTTYLLYREDRATVTRLQQTGRPLAIPKKLYRKHKLLSQALDGALQDAFREAGLKPPPCIAVPTAEPPTTTDEDSAAGAHCPAAGATEAQVAPHSTEEARDVQRAGELLEHVSIASDQASASQLALSRKPLGRYPVFRGELCDRCCLDTGSWVHVHLPSYGLCWTFRWVRGLRRELSRLGTDPGTAQTEITTEQAINLRKAVERNVRIRLESFYAEWDFAEMATDPEKRDKIWKRQGVDLEQWEQTKQRGGTERAAEQRQVCVGPTVDVTRGE